MVGDILPHSLPAPDVLRTDVERVLDIGAGIRPCPWFPGVDTVCVEPYGPYAQRLSASGRVVAQNTAIEFLCGVKPLSVDTILLLDVIEHMTRADGELTIALALKARPKQIVVFTPYGWMEQNHDAWGLGGDFWQKHRSAWTPKDFPGWWTLPYSRGFYAVWSASEHDLRQH